MRSKLVGVFLLLVVGEVIGVLLGTIFFHLFETTVPPALLTSFNKGTAHAAFIVYGAGAGLLIFIWSLVIAGSAHVFRGRFSR